VGIAEIILTLAVSMRIALTPLQGDSENRDRLVAALEAVTRLTLSLGALAAVTLALVARPLLSFLYGARYSEAGPALVWLVPGIVLVVAQGPLIDFLLAEARVRAVSIATLAGLSVNVGLNLVLLPHHSFVAAAAAATVSYSLSGIWIIVLFARHTGADWRRLLLVHLSDLRSLHPHKARTGGV
jgi:O-antigen/teichoic acid export membrane protein